MAKFTVEWLSRSFYCAKEDPGRGTEGTEGTEGPEGTEGTEGTEGFTPVSPNNSCGYTSASESSDVGEESEGEVCRRVRTKFSSEQVHKLEGAFSKHRYLGASQRKKIAERLDLSETQVKTWFQNRRMKLKREVQDMRTEFLPVPAALMPPMMFQHHALPGQLPVAGRGVYPLQETHGLPMHPTAPRHHHHYHPYAALAHQVIPAFY